MCQFPFQMCYKRTKLRFKSFKNVFCRNLFKTKSANTYQNERLINEICMNSSLTREDINRWYDGFMKDCPNGKLDLAQFEKFYKQIYPKGDAKKYCQAAFMTYDTDNSGYIEFDEFISVIAILSSNDNKQKFNLAFDFYDTNHNGVIERDEAFKIIKSIHQMYGEEISTRDIEKQVEKLFEHFDTDRNGELSKTEFVNGCVQLGDILKFNT